MGVRAHTHFDSYLALYHPLPTPLPVCPPYFQLGGGEDKLFILSNSTLNTPLPINNDAYPLCVSFFLVYVHSTVYVVLYIVVCSIPLS